VHRLLPEDRTLLHTVSPTRHQLDAARPLYRGPQFPAPSTAPDPTRGLVLRRPSGLRAFDLADPDLFRPSEAKHDRIKLRLETRFACAGPEQLERHLRQLPFLRHARARNGRGYTLKVADGFLFAGSGRLWTVGPARGVAAAERSAAGGFLFALVLDIDANPTRFLAHHEPAGWPFEHLAAMPPSQALRRNPELERQTRAAALDGNDNLLLGAARNGGQSFARRGTKWGRVVSIYLGHIQRLLHAAFTPSPCNPVQLAQPLELELATLTQLETYWEYETPDALGVVASLADHLQLAASDWRVRRYLPDTRFTDLAQARNCLSVTLPLNKEVSLVLYAKTLDRLRFEVRYTKNVRGIGARDCRGPVPATSILGMVQDDAAKRTRRVAEALREVAGSGEFERVALLDLEAALLQATDGDHEAARQLLRPLLHVGAVSRTVPDGIAPPEVLERLEDQGVLRRIRVRHGGVPRYVLAPSCAAMRSALVEGLPARRRIAARRSAAIVQ
jgi:hypothetical protein